ncbi:unnamed protein product [Cylicostephanus goldi]|uniref:NR LBD domain-containing protein n=1 Tax=Cylicostephanus goldi TaxID=71465 RepID=A0A3P6QEM7_CYLGO|nr:unnamed protein product [Cylicostephanus goldi]
MVLTVTVRGESPIAFHYCRTTVETCSAETQCLKKITNIKGCVPGFSCALFLYSTFCELIKLLKWSQFFERNSVPYISDIPNVTKETISIAEQVKNRLAEDVHSYYTYELRMPNYASRLHKMSSIVSAVDKLQERRKEDSQLSRLFNIFKHDVFMSELV